MSRIPTVDPKQATGKAQELLNGVQAKLGMTPNLMRAMANSPQCSTHTCNSVVRSVAASCLRRRANRLPSQSLKQTHATIA